jgi:hypothetical protein
LVFADTAKTKGRLSYEAAQQISEATSKSNFSAKTDARFRSRGEKSPGIRA